MTRFGDGRTSRASKKRFLTGPWKLNGLNMVDERAELAKTPNAAKHLGIHLAASLTIMNRRPFTSVLQATTEALRLKFSVMSHLWLLAKMRQSARQIFSVFTETTFPQILDELLLECFSPVPETLPAQGTTHEQQVRRQALKLCVRKGYSFQTASRSVYRDVEHRMEHQMQLLTIANSNTDLAHASSALATVHNTEVAQLCGELDRSRQSVRSRSPRGKEQLQQLALTNQAASNDRFQKKRYRNDTRNKSKEKCKNMERVKGQGTSDSAVRSSSGRSFQYILKDPVGKTFLMMNLGYDACRCQASRV